MASLLACVAFAVAPARAGPADFAAPDLVAIEGYDGQAMEPFLSRDGGWLFFNNHNRPSDRTDLHLARRVDDLHFRYVGPLAGANSQALDGVASMDRAGRIYFVSPRDYEATLNTLWQGRFADGGINAVEPLAGDVQRRQPLWLNMDAEISADGATLYFTENQWSVADRAVATSDILAAQRGIDGRFVRLEDAAALFAAVNTPLMEFAPATTADELTLYFTRVDKAALAAGRPDGFGLFVATRPDRESPFETPQRITAIAGYVEAPTVTPDGCAIYFHTLVGGVFRIARAARLDCGDG